jgi:hypothetical protein
MIVAYLVDKSVLNEAVPSNFLNTDGLTFKDYAHYMEVPWDSDNLILFVWKVVGSCYDSSLTDATAWDNYFTTPLTDDGVASLLNPVQW